MTTPTTETDAEVTAAADPDGDAETVTETGTGEQGAEAETGHTARGPVERLVLGAINLYRMTAPARIPRCRYIPTCSAYAVEAVEVHGLGRGLWLAARRLGRCHPFGSFGFDPVPEPKHRPSDEPKHQPDCNHQHSNPPERT